MRKWAFHGLLALVLASLLLMTSCGSFLDGSEESKSHSTQKKDPNSPPETEEMIQIYKEAKAVYEYMMVSHFPLRTSESSVIIEGMDYYRVEFDDIETMTDLKKYLKKYFSDLIIDEMLNQDIKRYREIDGALYGLNGDRGLNPVMGEEQFAYNESSDTKVRLEVMVEILGEDDSETAISYESYFFVYEKLEGKWVFTDFPYFR